MLVLGSKYRDRLSRSPYLSDTDVVWLPDNPDVDPRLAGHIDLSLFMPSPNILIAAPGVYDYFVNFLTFKSVPIRVIKGSEQGPVYPKDAGLCVCNTGKYVIFNPKTTDPSALDSFTEDLIPVTQGYTKCSVCVVNPETIITADRVTAARCRLRGMDVLEIDAGHISLDGFNYGFIGGAAFLLHQDTLAITGSLEKHPDKARIECFIRDHGVRHVYLTQEPVFDIGGGLALP